ncbi:M20 family metallopeptidase [Halalkalibacterium halodurans]|uniref:M20 family metallopeptidase n=1 Tax=Halalkalibacterium halodurans TaxID=86665 RepID=UPI002E24C5EC|nr:M20 family metallopeptidase [Halalkalibacterium halodurans]
MLSLLKALVNIDSGSYYKEGVDRVGRMLTNAFKQIGFKVAIFKQERYGDHLLFTHPHAFDPKILLVAHMDTVFPVGTAAARPFQLIGTRAYGPGVIDMKGSLVACLYAIKALVGAQSPAVKQVAVLMTSDEEIGAPSGREIIEKIGVGKKAVLVMEPARKDGSLVTARRGGGRYTLNVTGRAAHSGVEPEKGRSAIEELAHKIMKLHALSDYESGISVNVGVIEGGTAVNTVADRAKAKVDIRISRLEQAEPLDRDIRRICGTPDVDGTTIELKGGITRPPMERNAQTVALFQLIQQVASTIGLELTETATGGSSDASFTSALGIPTIDGMGPVGGFPHSEKEYLRVDTMQERTLLLAKVIERLSE